MEDETGDVENQYYKAKCMSDIQISYLSGHLFFIAEEKS
jgi:hypothetical protein